MPRTTNAKIDDQGRPRHGVALEPLVRRGLRHDWLVARHDYEDGDTNIIWGFAYVEWIWPPRARRQWFRHDGLPIRRLEIGPIAVGWGKTHEWFCFDSA